MHTLGLSLYSSFMLTYSTNAMIPVEIGEPSLKRIMSNAVDNTEALIVDLNLGEEVKNKAKILDEAYKRRVNKK